MSEKIGKVELNYEKYSGQDLYCDGAVEDDLLEIVKNTPKEEYGRVIEERRSWPVLYHLSPLRGNIIEWIPMERTAKVLEVGSGCGALTGVLARKAGSVTCVELSKKRSLINAHRNSECANVRIHVGNFKDIEPGLPSDFDYICLIGVFEYGQSYIGGDKPYQDFLKLLLPHLAPGGRILIAIENKYGLKYFAGCKEDHLGTYFSGIENYRDGGGVRTFSRPGLEHILKSCGVRKYRFYYPYPDYKFMTTLYSDAYLPGSGELTNNMRNFDRDRMLLFDENAAFDGMVEDGLFSVFSNSYLVVLGDSFDLKYVKYSNDRAPEYAIRTEICRDTVGRVGVRKYPVGMAAREHIRGMAAAYQNLRERYRGGRLEINRCELKDDGDEFYAQFEFVKGTPLSELLDACLEKDDMEGFLGYFREYIERISYNNEYPATDFDLTFSNILVDRNRWTLIDYEWTFGRPIETKELAFRAVHCYLLEDKKREKLDLDRITGELNITAEEAEGFREQERSFQKFVTGNRVAMAEMRDKIGYRMITPQRWIERYQDSEEKNRVQIYEDRGEGYKEEASYFVREAYQGENHIELKLAVSGDVRMLRIDPAFGSCLVKIQEASFNGQAVRLDKRKLLYTNGRILKSAEKGEYCPSIVFATDDPNINLGIGELERQEENTLHMRMEIVRLPMSMARDMAESVKKFI